MLESIQIDRFQAFAKMEIELDPHVTTIIGPSDVGKSSIIRALKWICTNRPSGDSFIRHGESTSRVVLHVDGRLLVRKKGDGKNSYSLDGHKYHALGAGGIPDEVSKLLNIGDVNFQGQHDPPFWFMLSPGEVSRELNQIINLGLIDSTLSNIASDLRQSRTTVSVAQDRLQQAEKQKDGLGWVSEANRVLSDLEAIAGGIQGKQQQVSRLDTLSRTIQEGQEVIQTRSEALEQGRGVVQVGILLVKDQKQLERLSELLRSIRQSEKEVGRKLPIKEVDTIGKLVESIQGKVKRAARLNELLQGIKEGEKEVCHLESSVTSGVSTLERLTGGNCPVCQKPMKKVVT